MSVVFKSYEIPSLCLELLGRAHPVSSQVAPCCALALPQGHARPHKHSVGWEAFQMNEWKFYFLNKQISSPLLLPVFYLQPKKEFLFFSSQKCKPLRFLAFLNDIFLPWYQKKGNPPRCLQRCSLFFSSETPCEINDANLCIFTAS